MAESTEATSRRRWAMAMPALLGTVAMFAASACGPTDRANNAANSNPGPDRAPPPAAGRGEARRLASATGFDRPDAIAYDSVTDRYFVSNTSLAVGAAPAHGFISRITSDGVIDSLHFIQFGRGGATLRTPMGIRVRADTLWVLDIDALEGFDTRSGAFRRRIDFSELKPGTVNDFDWGPDGAIYVTDMGGAWTPSGPEMPRKPMRILKISPAGSLTVALESPALAAPSGTTWDRLEQRFILAPFGGAWIQEWRIGQPIVEPVVKGPTKRFGRFDGVEVAPDGRVFITNWGAGSVYQLTNGALTPVIVGLDAAADVALDTRRGYLAVCDFHANKVEIWMIASPAA